MLLNFQARFAEAVANGTKRQTIRACRKDGRLPRVGEKLYLYTGLRTKKARKLREAKAKEVKRIGIIESEFGMIVCLGRKRLSPTEIFNLALDDGFENKGSFFSFFRRVHGLPFEGFLVRW